MTGISERSKHSDWYQVGISGVDKFCQYVARLEQLQGEP